MSCFTLKEDNDLYTLAATKEINDHYTLAATKEDDDMYDSDASSQIDLYLDLSDSLEPTVLEYPSHVIDRFKHLSRACIMESELLNVIPCNLQSDPEIFLIVSENASFYITWIKNVPLIRLVNGNMIHAPMLLSLGGVYTTAEESVIMSLERTILRIQPDQNSLLAGEYIPLKRARQHARTLSLPLLKTFLSDRLPSYFVKETPSPKRAKTRQRKEIVGKRAAAMMGKKGPARRRRACKKD